MTIFLVCTAVLTGVTLTGIGYCMGHDIGWSAGFGDGYDEGRKQ